MHIKSIVIKGFRNLKNTSLTFDASINTHAFVGLNGHGKTNLLESMFLTAISKSFRTQRSDQMVGFEQDFCSIKINLNKADQSKELEIIIVKNPLKKGLKINGVQKKASDYIGVLNVVFFSPDDMVMIHSAPGSRRRYMDLLLSQHDRVYLETSLKYQQALSQRNALLKRIKEGLAKEVELAFWDYHLADLGLKIVNKRANLIEHLNLQTARLYHEVSNQSDKLKIKYLPSTAKIKSTDDYLAAFINGRSKELATGYTQLGPHRDDLLFLCNGKNMASYASRGEWRSLILTLKFAEIYLLKEKTGEWPILLLDDVFSELDEVRQRYLFNELKEVQTFITTTHREFLDIIEGEIQVYQVSEGGFQILS